MYGMNSVVRPIAKIALPDFAGDYIYMHPVDVLNPTLPAHLERWQSTLEQMLDATPMKSGVLHVTIDEKVLTPGQFHRRGGAHIDGVWMPKLQTHGVAVPVTGGHRVPERGGHNIPTDRVITNPPRIRPIDRPLRVPDAPQGGHRAPQPAPTVGPTNSGGQILLSNYVACLGWNGQFNGKPGEGGDMTHLQDQLDRAERLSMEAGIAYAVNIWGIHESIPVQHRVNRSLIRLSLPETVVIQ